MNSTPGIRDSNRNFYSRYERWARRWSPFVSPLEIYDGLNIFARRQSATENRLNQRSQMTLVEQTPEVMDETATGSWLDFLCRQGLAYLRAHARYLAGLVLTWTSWKRKSRIESGLNFTGGGRGPSINELSRADQNLNPARRSRLLFRISASGSVATDFSPWL